MEIEFYFNNHAMSDLMNSILVECLNSYNLPLITSATVEAANRYLKESFGSVIQNNAIADNNESATELVTKTTLCKDWLDQKRTSVSLINGGNTCWLNAMLQCLGHTPALAQHL